MIRIEGQPILTAAEMRAAEERAAPTPDAMYALMERAGGSVADTVRRLAAGAEVLILCGPGNNGGDGYVAATALAGAGHPVRIAATGEPLTHSARRARAAWSGPVGRLDRAAPAPILVDALFGTGLTCPLDEAFAKPLHALARAARLRIAVDLPSGVATDDGAVPSAPFRFDLTLALGALKPSHLLQPAARYMGEVRVLDIGVPTPSAATALARPVLPEPGPDSHKFTRGLVLVIAGAMPGAAALAAEAAAHAGAGYVLLIDGGSAGPHAIVRRPWSPDALDDARVGAVVVGPGLGRDGQARDRFAVAFGSQHPLVIDGDALGLLALDYVRPAPTILTPHAGEFDRLFGAGEGGKIARARAAARRSDAVVVFKGADTVIAAPDGRVIVGTSPSYWLSTAGTGDVLAGACGAMLASGLESFTAAAAAVWLHGEAARRLGPAFLADDLAGALSAARS
ncbi:NAD(P)H-hydrate dehydratase [uncultured Sphingomonas sp.]|uniref:NAD(P)H-hydrate dehydratase n=1 Tax=uncultured Sphingomonas sp. TaxID=158754 RepID=UPI0035CBBF38